MKLLILYQPSSEHARMTEEFVRDFAQRYPEYIVESLDADSVGGAEIVELYDAVQYPAFLVLASDGQLLKSWSGGIPLADEIAGYLH